MAATLGAVMAGNGHIAHAGYYNQNGVPPFGGRHPSMKSMEMSYQIWFGIGNGWSTPVGDKGIMASQFEGEPVNEQVVANMYGAMRSELNQIYSKITELEMEVSEHSLVISAIQPLDPSRRCYRMIGGVLVERTIKEVMPAVQRNKEGLEEVIARLNEALEKKKKEITQFEAKYKIRIRKPEEMKEEDSSRKEGTAQGVLVGPASGGE